MKNEKYDGDEDKGHVESGVGESGVKETHVQGEKRGAIERETKGTDHRTRLGGKRRELLWGVSGRGVSCCVLQGGRGTTVKAETIGLSGG